jgi:hypothetical protein
VTRARGSSRLPRRLRDALPTNPTAGVATAIVGGAAAAVVVVVVVLAVIIATVTSSGLPAGSIVGAWSDPNGGVFVFAPSGPDIYTVSLRNQDPQCDVADDGSVRGSNGHYTGSINLYPQDATGASGSCVAKSGTAQITISVTPNSNSASVDVVGDNCTECGQMAWTRQ